MVGAFFVKHRFALKWTAMALMIKGLLFLVFAFLFYQNWPQELIINSVFVASGDTDGYYLPVEAFVDAGHYSSYCRMPGLLPIYAPLYFLFGGVWGKTLVILLQFLVSSLSVYFLAQTAAFVFKSSRVFYFTFFLYALSSFVSNWDHYGLSDSFGASFLVYGIYFCVKFRESRQRKDLLLSGLFIAWSVFFRPVHGIIIPLLILLYLADLKQWRQSLRNCILFCLPVVLALGLWTYSNYQKYQKVVVLQGPMSECFGTLSPELLAIRSLIIGWGGDYQPWSKGSEAEWFFSKKTNDPERGAIHDKYLTSAYSYDSLLVLREKYNYYNSDSITAGEKPAVSRDILETSARYLSAYKAEHPVAYRLLNKFRLLKQLLLPGRLDDFPTPKLSEMNILHKGLKAFYFLFFLFVSVVGVLTCLFALYKRIYFAAVPLALVLLIGAVLGYVEQRYLVPAFPFLLMFSAWGLSGLRRKTASSHT